MGDPEATAATQLSKQPTASLERRSPTTEDTPPTQLISPLEAMRADEIARVHIFSLLMIVLNLLGVILIQFLGGDTFAKQLFGAALVVTAANYGALYYISNKQQRYNERAVGIIAHLCCFPGFGILYYFGVFSPVGIVLALGLYVYSLGSSFRWCFSVFVFLSLTHGVLAGLISFDVVQDRGLIRADALGTAEKVLIQTSVLGLYGLAFVLGRSTRQKTLDAITELERATRQAAEREVLLNEARAELARAHQIGGPGRYTDATLGPFKLGVVLGRGAMGEVYEALDRNTDEVVAIKLMHPHTMLNPNHFARFLREVNAAAALTSPNIVRVVEVAPDDAPTPYLAMERLRGEDLTTHLREHRRMKMQDVIDMVRQVGGGLQAAHDAGIVHRDLKPQNVFRAQHGDGPPVWKILDFGVSKLVGATGTLTQNNVIGTPAYMAPEQASGGEVDHRADLYALASIAYRCLTGRPAFSGKDPAQLLYKAVNEMPVRPSALVSYLDADVDRVFAIGLTKRRVDRFDSASELADALQAAARGILDGALRQRGDRLIDETPWSKSA